ncbi:MAG: lactate utilization protein [Candidatus Brocadiia bacterium]
MTFEKELREALTAFAAKGYETHYVQNRDAALELCLKFATPGCTTAMGGSTTLREIGLPERLRSAGVKIVEAAENATPEEHYRSRLNTLDVDVYYTGTNALTRTGCLVNIDGYGNRVAAQIFGPRKLVIVAGRNKLVGTLAEALYRVKFIAAPPNVRRRNTGAPCGTAGICTECAGDCRICNDTVIIENVRFKGRNVLIMVDETLGF